MKMTYEQVKNNPDEMIQIIRDVANGKQLQYRRIDCPTDGWSDASMWISSMSDSNVEYRIKPESKLRPWKPEEVPVGAWIRYKGQVGYFSSIMGVTYSDIYCADEPADSCMTFQALFDSHEHSLDHGKTWLPCGVESTE